MKLKNIKHIPLIIIFFTILILPVIQQYTNIFPDLQVVEKRELAERPKLLEEESVGLKEYPKQFEQYYNDNFGFRGTVIATNGYTLDKIFDVSPSDRVVIGKDDWLFFNNRQSLVDYEGRIQYTEEELSMGVQGLVRNWRKLEKMGITYLFVVAPDKSTIYSEFMPDHLQKKHENANSRLDQFLTRLLSEYPDFPILDLRPALFKAKQKEIIYNKRDTHWNKRGAYVGYTQIMNWLVKKGYSELLSTPRKNLLEIEGLTTYGDLSDYINSHVEYMNYSLERKKKGFQQVDLTDLEINNLHKAERFVNNNSNLPKVVMYKDSFTINMRDFLSEHFSNILYIHEFPCHVNLDVVRQNNPDIVIHESIERGMHDILRFCINDY
ncbi:hypothetical protein ACFL0U_00330 [Pseudomonadota bacterium]